MFVKKFEGPTVNAALAAAKRELGDEALLLSTRTDPDDDGIVQVTVAIERPSPAGATKVREDAEAMDAPDVPAPADLPDDMDFAGLGDLVDEIVESTRDEEDPFERDASGASGDAAPEDEVPPEALLAAASAAERRKRSGGFGPTQPASPSVPGSIGSGGSVSGDSDPRSVSREEPGDAGRTEPAIREPGEPGDPGDFDTRFLILSRRVEDLARGLRTETGTGEQQGTFAVPSFEEIVGRLEATGLEQELCKGAARVVIARSGEEFESEEIFLSVLAEGLASLVEPDAAPPPREGGPRVFAVVGPNGTGKTTTAAKIAALAQIVHGKRAALIGADDYRIGAADQLLEHAGLIGTVFERASTPEELQGLLQALHEFDLVVVDTAGFPPSDGARMWELARLLDGAPGVLPLLVLSASTRGKDLAEAIGRFRALGGLRLVITKLDETDCYGEIFGEVAASGCPVAWLSAGQAVPDDIEECTPIRLAELVVRAAWTGRKANQ